MKSRRMPVELQIIISVSRVQIPPSRCDVAQSGRAGSFHHTLVAGARARCSVVEQPPFKRCVVGSIPTGHTRNSCRRNACGTTRRRGPSGLEVLNPPCWFKSSPGFSLVAETVSHHLVLLIGKERNPPANAEGTTLQHPSGVNRAGSTPLLAGAQTANASAHTDAGRVPGCFFPFVAGVQIFRL